MLRILSVVALVAVAGPVFADGYTHGYFRNNGTYVGGYYHTSRDSTVTDNYSYSGNVNPYTGSIGTNNYLHDQTSPYFVGPESNGNVGHSGYGYAPQW